MVEVLLPEHYLEVGFTPDGREIIINHPVDAETVRRGMGHIVFSPDQARHLAKLLLRKADECSPSRPEIPQVQLFAEGRCSNMVHKRYAMLGCTECSASSSENLSTGSALDREGEPT